MITMYFILSFDSGWVAIPYFLLSLLSVTLDNSCISSTIRVEPIIRPALQLRPHPYPVKNSSLLCPYTTLNRAYSDNFLFFATTLSIHSYSCVIHPNRQMLFCSAIAKLFPACIHAFNFLSFVCAEFHLTDLTLSFDLIPQSMCHLGQPQQHGAGAFSFILVLCLHLSTPIAFCLSFYRPAGEWRAGEEEHTSSLAQV